MLAGPARATAPASAPAPALAPEATGPADGLLVRFDGSASNRAVERAVADAGGTLEHSADDGGFVKISTGSKPAAEVQAALAASPVVDLVEPNRIRYAEAVPSDPRYSSQASYLQAIHLPEAWDRVTGNDSMVLAVIDSGVQLSHPDLAGRLVPGYDFVNRDPTPEDDFGHGTMVAGIAAASTNNGVGVAGAIWSGKLMPIKVLDSRGAANDDNIAAGIRYAVDRGADVINLSLGGPGASTILQNAVDYATTNDVVVVGAAGNDGDTEPHYPAACEGVVAVGAVDNAGNLASFSSRGSWISMVAPGVSITTTTRASSYGQGSGTSFSSPLVAAVAFLLRAADPNATQQSIVARLMDSADDLGAPGFDNFTGVGQVNARAALDETTFSTASSGLRLLDVGLRRAGVQLRGASLPRQRPPAAGRRTGRGRPRTDPLERRLLDRRRRGQRLRLRQRRLPRRHPGRHAPPERNGDEHLGHAERQRVLDVLDHRPGVPLRRCRLVR